MLFSRLVNFFPIFLFRPPICITSCTLHIHWIEFRFLFNIQYCSVLGMGMYVEMETCAFNFIIIHYAFITREIKLNQENDDSLCRECNVSRCQISENTMHMNTRLWLRLCKDLLIFKHPSYGTQIIIRFFVVFILLFLHRASIRN